MIFIRIAFCLIVVGVIITITAILCKKAGKPFPWGILIGICVLIVIAMGVKGCNTAREEARKEARAKEEKLRTNETRIIVQAERPWTFQTIDIPAEGVPVYLYQGWKDWPKGGAISITTPGGQVLQDQPGEENHFGYQPNGIYVFRANPVGSARKVQILNRW